MPADPRDERERKEIAELMKKSPVMPRANRAHSRARASSGQLVLAAAAILCLAASGLAADLATGKRAYEFGDYAGALRELEPLAQLGDATAQYYLGLMYHNGQGVTQDWSKAARWYRRAAEQGSPNAQYGLAGMYSGGEGLEQDHEEAARWCRLAADQGYAPAEGLLGTLYSSGKGVPQDHIEAAKWIQLAADQGDPAAQLELSRMYGKGEGVPQDYFLAHRWASLWSRWAAAQGWLPEGASAIPNAAAFLLAHEPLGRGVRLLSPGVLFERVSSSVVVLEALDITGKVLALGSGVVVAPGRVVSNYHVVQSAVTLRVRHGQDAWSATIAHVDTEHDLVQLGVHGLEAFPVVLRNSWLLQMGERVYAIGAPQGLELTLSEGLISSLRPAEGTQLIQTTAPVSRGSSGGGLFDAGGRLIGITTFQVKEGQNLNFAIPTEWVSALEGYPSTPPARTAAKPTVSLEETLSWLKSKLDSVSISIRSERRFSYRGCTVTLERSQDLAGLFREKGPPIRGSVEFSLQAIQSVGAEERVYPALGPEVSTYLVLSTGRSGAFRVDGAWGQFELSSDRSTFDIWLGRARSPGDHSHLALGKRLVKAFLHAVALCGGSATEATAVKEPF